MRSLEIRQRFIDFAKFYLSFLHFYLTLSVPYFCARMIFTKMGAKFVLHAFINRFIEAIQILCTRFLEIRVMLNLIQLIIIFT